MPAWKHVSLWMDQLGETVAARPCLDQDRDVDVAIIGAGFTGLWTAYYLKRQAPQLNIVVLEAQTSGFGASGRNGGWLIGGMLGEARLLGHLSAERRRQAYRLLQAIPDEVQGVLQREGIDCHYRKAGMLNCAARYPEQATRLRQELQALYEEGHDENDYRWLDQQELAAQVRIPGAYGAIYSPHCATISPARLVRGLADAVERLGVSIHDQSPVSDWHGREIRTDKARIRAQWVVPAVEGYAADFAALKRIQIPVQSMLVATEPLSAERWERIGLDRGQALCEHSRQVTYAQRTLDDRLVFGARGGYRFGGRLRADFQLSEDEIGLRRMLMESLFPSLRGVRLTHAWGGNLGMARRFRPHMLCDRQQGLALAGGFGGEGVGATHLAGQTLADLILERNSSRVEQPWVIREKPLSTLPTWEPEPCRWLAYKGIMSAFANEDRLLADPNTAPWHRTLASSIAASLERLMR
ncbi:NAD(P)/FAD-dependent oxidoreductase [Phytopseudomonas daroniae]|uniref:NAD(P)/FAD-dependent oxidoreductase n=1 Tax=Phytopseudomonas daroniae TaxID=2487519 RepID=UPI0010384D03|nr:FAD-dependent oxidoreductase [Pseudomonas daroniae]TBU74005.1 FAD-dependent oxidoreductase [Pseudomonas daroniae]